MWQHNLGWKGSFGIQLVSTHQQALGSWKPGSQKWAGQRTTVSGIPAANLLSVSASGSDLRDHPVVKQRARSGGSCVVRLTESSFYLVRLWPNGPRKMDSVSQGYLLCYKIHQRYQLLLLTSRRLFAAQLLTHHAHPY